MADIIDIFTRKYPRCGARENYKAIYSRSDFPCHLELGHEGSHQSRDGRWTPESTAVPSDQCEHTEAHRTFNIIDCWKCGKWLNESKGR